VPFATYVKVLPSGLQAMADAPSNPVGIDATSLEVPAVRSAM
jgi:hypothetical protein